MRVSTDLPQFVHRKRAKGRTYYYFALDGVQRGRGALLVRLPDRTDPSFERRVAELHEQRPPISGSGAMQRLGERRVYFIGGEEGPIKIGMSRDPEARCREMNIGAPTDYSVLATVVGGVELERAYHSRFGFARMRGEWFERTAEIQGEIDRLNKAGK